MNRQSRQIFEFGNFRLDVERARLTKDGELVSLAPKAVSLLTILVKHHGRAVEKEELMETIWPGLVVEDSNLTQTVHILRKAISKHSDSNITIETLPRFGYRLIADIRECSREFSNDGAELVTQPIPPPVTFESQVNPPRVTEEQKLSVGETNTGFFRSLQKYLLVWLQKRIMKVSLE